MPVLLFALITSLVTGVAFGIAPAWMATRVDPMESLRGASRSTARAGSLPRKTLVVLQAALSLVLLSAAGLLTAALQNLENQNSGFEQDRRLVVSINPRLAGYRSAQLPPLYRRIHDSLATVPGVSSVALCLYSPQSGGGWGAGVWVDGHPAPGPGMTTPLRGIGLRRDTLTSSEPRSSKDAASPSRTRRPRGMSRSSMRRSRGSSSETKIPSAGTSAGSRRQAGNSRSWAWPKMRAI